MTLNASTAGRQRSLYLHDDLMDRLATVAKKEKRSLSQMVEIAVDKYLGNGQHKPTSEEKDGKSETAG